MVAETRSAARRRKLAEAGPDPEQSPQAEPDSSPPNKRARTAAVTRRTRPAPAPVLSTRETRASTSGPSRPSASSKTSGASKASAKAAPNGTTKASKKPPKASIGPRTSKVAKNPKPPKLSKPEREVRLRCNVCMELCTVASVYQCLTCKAPRSCNVCLHEETKAALDSDATNAILACWRCQNIVPISATSTEFKRESKPEDLFNYNVRAEERVDRQPLYCPKPRCSAFIPPRLYASTRPSVMEAHERINRGVNRHKRRNDFLVYFDAEMEPTACCPGCFTLVCTSCRKEYHGEGGECDPESLQKEANVKDLKQCPFCQAAVEHAGGCPIVGCACGQYFCILCGSWPCLCKHE